MQEGVSGLVMGQGVCYNKQYCKFRRKEPNMVKRNFIRLLAALLVIVLCSPAVFADAGQRLEVERQVFD